MIWARAIGVLWASLALVTLPAPAAPAAGMPVALVADVAGSVLVMTGQGRKRARPIGELEPIGAGIELRLEAQARLTLFYTGTGQAFDLQGPGRFAVRQDAVLALEGASAPARRKLIDPFRDIRLKGGSLAQAGLILRGSKKSASEPQPLQPRGVVLPAQGLIFAWSGAAGGDYRFILMDGDGNSIHKSVCACSEYMLPQEVALEPGRPYFWHVEAVEAKAAGAPRWLEFILADEDLRAFAAEIDGALGAPDAAERNLRQMLLLQRWQQSRSSVR